jgi:hypothetical protein
MLSAVQGLKVSFFAIRGMLLAAFLFVESSACALEPSADELAVYRALFSGDRLVVLRESGIKEKFNPDDERTYAPYHDGFVAEMHKRFPTAQAATIEGFFPCRHLPGLLTPNSDVGVRVVMLDSETGKKLYGQGGFGVVVQSQRARANAWSAFLWHYKGARAATYVTRVGLNADATQALVYLQETTGPTGGDDRYTILLDCANNVWSITKKDKEP